MLARLQNGSLDDALRGKHTSNSAGYRRSPVLLESKARMRIATEVAEALAHLHGLGLVHGRLQPSTILLGEGLTAKLGDTALRGPVKPRGQVRPAFNRCHAAREPVTSQDAFPTRPDACCLLSQHDFLRRNQQQALASPLTTCSSHAGQPGCGMCSCCAGAPDLAVRRAGGGDDRAALPAGAGGGRVQLWGGAAVPAG